MKKGAGACSLRDGGIFFKEKTNNNALLQSKNKTNSRQLRSHQTDAELLLWSHIRRKQIKDTQFYRQKPIGNFIVDFYAPSAKLVIEVDGGQHFEEGYLEQDKKRDLYLKQLNLKVLRFDNLQVLQSINDVLEVIYEGITKA